MMQFDGKHCGLPIYVKFSFLLITHAVVVLASVIRFTFRANHFYLCLKRIKEVWLF